MASTMPTYTPYDYAKAYEAAEKAQRAAEEAAYNQTKANLDAQAQKLGQQYTRERSNIYTNARMNAIGNNEAMAANGLAGGLYSSPTTGYSESSRIKQNLALQNSLNDANLQEQSARDDIALQIIDAGYTRDKNIAEYLAQQAINRANSEAAENQFGANYNFNAWQAAQQAEQWAAEQAYTKAINEVNTFGKVMTKEAANTLGMAIGTPSWAVQQAQAAKKTSTSRSSSSSRRSSGSSSLNFGNDSSTTVGKSRLYETARSYISAKADAGRSADSINKTIEDYVGRGWITPSEGAELKAKYSR